MARAKHTYAVRLAVEGGGRVKAELVEVGTTGDRSLKRIETGADRAGRGLRGLTERTRALGVASKALGAAAVAAAGATGLGLMVDRAITAADNIGKTADKIGVGVEALQELRFAAQAAGIEQRTLDMALQRFTRRAAEAAKGTGEAKEALAGMGIALRDGSGRLRRTEDLLGDVADALMQIEDPAERVRIAFKLFDSEGVAMVNMLSAGAERMEAMRREARELGIVIDEHLVRNAEEARTKMDTLATVISQNVTKAILGLAQPLSDASGWFAEFFKYVGFGWENLSLILQGDWDASGRSLPNAEAKLQRLTDHLAEIKQQRDALEGKPGQRRQYLVVSGHVADLEKEVALWQERVDALKALRAEAPAFTPPSLGDGDGAAGGGGGGSSTRRQIDANRRLLETLRAERRELAMTERQRSISQAVRRLSADATEAQRAQVRELAGALYDERQAAETLRQARQQGLRVAERLRTAEEVYADEIAQLNALLRQGAIDHESLAQASAEAFDRMLADSREWHAGVRRALRGFGDEAGDMADAFEQATSSALRRSEDAFVQWARTGKFSAADLFNSIAEEALRMAYRVAIIKPLGGVFEDFLTDLVGNISFGGGSSVYAPSPLHNQAHGMLGHAHQGGQIGGPNAFDYRPVPLAAFADAPRFHGGGLVPGEVPIVAKQGEVIGWPEQMRHAFGSDVTVQIIDQRSSGAEPEVSRERGPNGRDTIRVLIRDEVGRGIAQGWWDQSMAGAYGLNRRGVPR